MLAINVLLAEVSTHKEEGWPWDSLLWMVHTNAHLNVDHPTCDNEHCNADVVTSFACIC